MPNTMESAKILKNNAEAIALSLVTRQYQQRTKEWGKYGVQGLEKSVRDARYLLDYLYEAVVADDSQILIEFSLWADELFRGLKLPESAMLETLKCLRSTLTEEYPDILPMVEHHLEASITAINKSATYDHDYIHSSKLKPKVQQYINYLLEGNRHAALRLIDELASNGESVKDIYLEIFQPAQYEIGNLWLKNQISVAKEHFCTAVTQQAMSILYPKIFSTERKGLSFVAACLGNELHEIGIRMVADFFEMDGWDTYYLGANTPTDSIIKAVNEKRADILGLSIALPIHRSLLKEVISNITPKLQQNTKIIIGGYALNNSQVNPDWFGANGFAPNAPKAVELANSLAA